MTDKTKIFISYRREDSAFPCGSIYDRLVTRFGRENVFKDVDAMPDAVDFRQHIRAVLAESAVTLVVIGGRWLNVKLPDGRRRLDVPDDPVRMEIETALAEGVAIIPLLLDGIGMPAAADLPESLRPLADRAGRSVRPAPDFESDMRHVIAGIERLMGDAAPAQPPPPLPHANDITGQLIARIRSSYAARDWLDVEHRASLLIRQAPLAATAHVYLMYGTALMALGKPAEAEPILRDGLGLSADQDERLAIMPTYADALTTLKRWPDLLTTAEAALRLAPDDPHWLEIKWRALVELGRRPEALEVVRRITARHDATAAQWLDRARMEADFNHLQETHTSLEAAARVAGPADPAVAQARAELFPQPEIPRRLLELGFRGASALRASIIVPPVVSVPAGAFLMGSEHRRDQQAGDNELPQHTITLPAFAIARFPVTVAEYACFVRAGQAQPGNWQQQLAHPDHPVTNINSRDAMAYAAWLAKLTGQLWRLPTEAEWEKAARGTDGRIYPWGDQWDKSRCNSTESGIHSTTTSVGSYPTGASPYGALDMAGNVWEWTSTLMKPYPYSQIDGREDPHSAKDRVLRGGAWDALPRNCRAAYRNSDLPGYLSGSWGFRVVLSAS